MFRSLLVGLDGSAHADAALELGLRWAKQLKVPLGGVAVVDEPGIRHPQAVPLGGDAFKEARDSALLADARAKVEQILSEFNRRCGEAGVVSQAMGDVGDPVAQILREAQRFDLILLGQQTRFRFETQDEPDETLREVIKHSPRPVVAVPTPLPESQTVMVAYDGSIQAARAMSSFCASGLRPSQPVLVVTVASDEKTANQRAAVAVDFLKSHDLNAEARPIVTHKSPPDVVLEQARELGAGLVVMGAYGQPFLREFFLGSVTSRMIAESPAPLFLDH